MTHEYDPTTFDFDSFAKAIKSNIDNMLAHDNVFRVKASGQEVWDMYLASFPEGTNPMFRERTYHDGNYDKNFIRRMGNVVTIENGVLRSIWDVSVAPFPYNIVAQELSKFVKSFEIENIFRVGENNAGHEKNIELLDDGNSKTWTHFYTQIKKPFYTTEAAAEIGKYSSRMGVFLRGLNEITPDAVETVVDLIADGAIYRGEEFKEVVTNFQKVQERYLKLFMEDEKSANIFAWSQVPNTIKNSSIGTLLEDISNNVDLEKAVASYENKVAPENYKRSSAVITQKMVKSAFEEIEKLGLKDALDRRYANIGDVSINDVIWVDNSTKSKLKGSTDIFDVMMDVAKPIKSDVKSEKISIAEFLKDVLPKAKSLEVMVKNKHQSNFMSVTAPQHEDSERLFKWDNGFAWSYNGNITDSFIRKEVQARGGSVSGVFRFSHSWNHSKRNASLMDLHVFMPGNNHKSGVNDSYGNNTDRVGWNHRQHYQSGGVQDVDYTDAAPVGYVPVENITFPNINKMPEGEYKCKIHNWRYRSPTEGGFKAEIEFGGQIFEYSYDKPLKNKEWVDVATVTLKNGAFTIVHHLPHSTSSTNIWGIDTEKFNKVRTIILSPNYWEGSSVGNKHWFFILEGCKNPEPTRGIYNEFLRDELNEHRKVFEVLGSKTKCEPVDDQLSGIGFSSTKKDELTVEVTGDTFKKMYTIEF